MCALAPQIGITGGDAIAIAAFMHFFEKQLIRDTRQHSSVL